MKIFLDSSILIDFLRASGQEKSSDVIKSLKTGNTGFVSSITVAEVSVGAYRSTRRDAVQKTRELFSNLRIIDLDEKIAVDGGRIQAQLMSAGKEIDLPDCLIAATALSLGMNVIITRNLDHFSRIQSITAITPEQFLDNNPKKV